jgi:hypothetical protein
MSAGEMAVEKDAQLIESQEEVPAGQPSPAEEGAGAAAINFDDPGVADKLINDLMKGAAANEPQIGEKLLDDLVKGALLAKQAAVEEAGSPPSILEDHLKKVCINRSVWVSSPATSQCSKPL